MQAGELIAGRYRLDDRIDGGAMGDVWRGHDTRLNRTVAIKLLRSGLSDNARFRARFQHEAQAVASLQAPGVVSLYDYGEESTSDGIVSYLIMELVKGRSLASILDERRTLPVAETMRLIAAAAEALHAAHHAGIVHRDVKPGNMLVGTDGNVTIVDFGIARARGEAGLTETGMVMGTLSYCSPEQLCDRELTPASDVYSLGIVAYECLSGRVPFPSSSPGAAINGHLHQAPPPLAQVSPIARDVVMRSLEKDPNRRWRSAAEFADACRAAASGRGTAVMAAPPVSPSTTATRIMGTATPTAPTPPRQHTSPIAAVPPAPTRPLREEPTKRGGAGVAVAVTAVLAGLVLLVALIVWQQWDNETPTNANDSATPTADSVDPGTDTPPSPDSGEQANPPDNNDDDDDPSAPVPQIQGLHVTEARTELAQVGFREVRVEVDDVESDNPCVVVSADPNVGEVVELDERIELVIAGTEEQCSGLTS